MTKMLLTLLVMSTTFRAPEAFGNVCAQLFEKRIDQTSEILKNIETQQEIYRNDLYKANKLDPQFLYNFARQKESVYLISEVIQNYPIPQAKESALNVLERLKYVRDNWADFNISSRDAEHFSIEIYHEWIAKGEALLKQNKWPFYETMDFIDAGLMYGASLRSSKEADGVVADPTYIEIRNDNIRLHGKSDPVLMYQFAKSETKAGIAFEYLPHPALISLAFVQDRLFEYREFNWAMTKGAYLSSVAPHRDIQPHDISSSYWSLYHDLTGHFRSTAISKTVKYLENIYVKKGFQKIDNENGNKNEAQKLLKLYIEMREDFLTDLLSKGEKHLSEKDQQVFHESIFEYMHENGGASIAPQRMYNYFSKHKEQNTANIFIIKNLKKYIKTHNLEVFE